MASMTIHNLDGEVKTRLRARAGEHHRPMEEEGVRHPVRGNRARAELPEPSQHRPLAFRAGEER